MFVSAAHGLPQNIAATSTDPASLRVHWEPPSDMHEGSITGYVIQYTRIGSNDKKNIKVDRETTHTISGLVACEGYSVQVATMTDNATGPFSDAVVEVAGEDGELCIQTHIKTHGSESRVQEEAGRTRRTSELFTGSTAVKFVNALNKLPLKLSLSYQ